MKKLFNNKRGDSASILIMILVVFTLAVGGILGVKVMNEMFGEMKAMPEINQSNNTMDALDTIQDNAVNWIDFLFFFSIVATIIGLIISSMYIDVPPALAMVFIIGLIVAIFVAGQLSNVFAEFSQTSEISATANQFSMMQLIMPILPFLILGVGIMVGIIIYGKPRGVGGI